MHSLSQSPALARPAAFPNPSRTLSQADRRIRDLAETMVRLNAETSMTGGCTRTLLRAEGFSDHELDQYTDAATQLANSRFVRDVAAEDLTPPTDEELIDHVSSRAIDTMVAPARLRQLFKGALIDDDRMFRIWPKVCARIARQVATMPVAGAL